MSTREWNEMMYGIELPSKILSNESIMNFVNNHSDVLSEICPEAKFPMSEYDAIIFAEEYEDYTGNYGTDALINDVIGNVHIDVTVDEYNSCYVGTFATKCFPWYNLPETWHDLTREDVENAIRPVIEELYGECPAFDEHEIWYFG